MTETTRILLVSNPEPDYTQDVVYHGLVSLLGAENVVEHPRAPRYHETATPEAPYPMLRLGVPDAAPRGALDEMVAWSDAVVVGSLNRDAHAVARDALRLAKAARKPTAFLDGGDDPYVKEIFRHVDVYFKREVPLRNPFLTPLPLQRLYFRWRAPQFVGPLREAIAVATSGMPGILPLPFGVIDHGQRASREKDFDVAFMGLPTSRERVRARDALRRLSSEGIRVYAPDERLSWWDYLDILARSRIGISLRGHGFDTYRYWEIPALGTMLLSETPRIEIPDNFEHGREAWFAAPESMPAAVREVLASADVAGIARAGHEKLLRKHTSHARGRTVLDALRARMRR